MKKMLRVEKILFMLVVIALICGLTTFVKAEEADPNGIININVTTTKPDNTAKPENTNTNNSNNNANINANVGNANSSEQKKLPKTGANDTAMWVVIGGCVVLAIYTYKKVRDYNV